MIVRATATSDFGAIEELVAAAFARPDEAHLVIALRRDGDAVLDLVADDAGSIVGHAMFSPVRAPFPALSLGPVAVSRENRNKGIASALIRRGLDEAARAGWRGVFVFGAPTFYSRFGFNVGHAQGFTSPYAGPHFMAAELGGPLPAMTGRVDYAPAFAALS